MPFISGAPPSEQYASFFVIHICLLLSSGALYVTVTHCMRGVGGGPSLAIFRQAQAQSR